MKIGVIKRIQKEDLARAGGELPGWLDPFLLVLNQFIEPVTNAIKGKLTFEDNFSAKKVLQTFESGVEQRISAPSRVAGILPVDCSGKTLDKWALTRNADGTVSVTLTFDGGGEAECLVYLLLG